MAKRRRTVCDCSDCDDDRQRPVKDESEKNQRDDNVDKRGDDVEQYQLQIYV